MPDPSSSYKGVEYTPQVELIEDRETGDIWLSYYRGAYAYKMKGAYAIQLRLQEQ